ncbi:MAG: hypothetical protein A4S09_03510 [Proteobacteria bacterium SG_bin7]|nr:MAG: hypothetical protein A4S09_03510 [Proteobacteria bacterium SG_bin7]
MICAVRNITEAYYRGKYKDVLSIVGRNPIDVRSEGFEIKTSFQIGALVFLGELHDAKIIFERAIKLTNPTLAFICRSRFFLGVGYVRTSDYATAKSYFAQNILAKKKCLNSRDQGLAEISFYALQGSAFFRFFRGQFRRTVILAQRAYAAAFEDGFKYGQILALDLLGHSFCMLGLVRRGTFELEKALALAKSLGNGGIEAALSVSLEKYNAQFGLDIQNSIQRLNNAITSLSSEDVYSKAELYLELIRQLILRGRGKAAQKIIEKVGSIVYQHQNKRQSAIFNLRYSHLLLLRGDPQAALALTNALKSNLDPKIDIVISQQADGLSRKIKEHINREVEVEEDINFSANSVDERIKRRRFINNLSLNNLGEDPLGDILDRIRVEGRDLFYEIKKLGLFGLLPQVLNIPIGSSGIYLGPSRGEILIINGGDVVCPDQGITGPIKKLILYLFGSEYKSKEFLIEKVWNYSYNSSIHDSLLHATIGKLRNLLGDCAGWVEWSNSGYKLTDSISLFNVGDDKISTKSKSSLDFVSAGVDLNSRQIGVLQSLKPGNFINVKKYTQIYKVSSMTACRDLSYLHKVGRVVRIGRGRATSYCLS